MAEDPATSIVVSTSTLIYTGRAKVDWVMVSAGTDPGTWELNDSTDDSGTDRLGGYAPNTNGLYFEFPKGTSFTTGIYADIQDGRTVYVCVGYTPL